MKWALINNQDIIENVISYDGDAEYNPPEGLLLVQVNDWLNIGSHVNDSEPVVSIEIRREICVNNLIQKRNQVLTSGVSYNGYVFGTDDNVINLMLQSITMQGLGISTVFPRDWILADNSVISVSYDDIKLVATLIQAKKDSCYGNYILIMNEINISNNPESINIDSGWPV